MLTIELKRLAYSELLDKYCLPKADQGYNCTHDKACGKFGKRPCCPPRIWHITDKSWKYFYAIYFRIPREDNAHRDTRWDTNSFFFANWAGGLINKYHTNMVNSVQNLLLPKSTILKINGCKGCIWTKQHICKNKIRPQPEGIGINVVEIVDKVFDSPVIWIKNNNRIPYYTGLGGILTDTELKPLDFKKAIQEAHDDYNMRQKTYPLKKEKK